MYDYFASPETDRLSIHDIIGLVSEKEFSPVSMEKRMYDIKTLQPVNMKLKGVFDCIKAYIYDKSLICDKTDSFWPLNDPTSCPFLGRCDHSGPPKTG